MFGKAGWDGMEALDGGREGGSAVQCSAKRWEARDSVYVYTMCIV